MTGVTVHMDSTPCRMTGVTVHTGLYPQSSSHLCLLKEVHLNDSGTNLIYRYGFQTRIPPQIVRGKEQKSLPSFIPMRAFRSNIHPPLTKTLQEFTLRSLRLCSGNVFDLNERHLLILIEIGPRLRRALNKFSRG